MGTGPMRWGWCLLWILLFASQLILALLMRPGDGLPATRRTDPGHLLELAEATDREWAEMRERTLGAETALQNPAENSPGNPFDRERLLLRIRDAESRLLDGSVDTLVADSLRDWLDTGQASASAEGATKNLLAYLEGLLSVLEVLASAPTVVSMERLRLEPDNRSEFPALYIEASGRPIEIGDLLYAGIQKAPAWNLLDLELAGPPVLDAWWLMGSCAFQPESVP